MSEQWVLVDGYSVLHAWPKLRRLAGRALEQQRDALIRVLRQYADQSGRQLTVVFDGYAAKHRLPVAESSRGVEVLYSRRGKTADDVIERLVGGSDKRSKILVVTSDSLERQTVESMGAHSMSAEAFEAEVEAALKDLAGLVRAHSRPQRITRIGGRLEH